MNEAGKHTIDLSDLQILRSVAHFRSFTKAAQSCGISQSALTRQVQMIEAKLGVSIFERTTRSVVITEAGAVLLRETEPIGAILKGALRRIEEDYLNAQRHLRVGISKGLTLSHLPGLFPQLEDVSQASKISVSQPKNHTLVQAVALGQFDVGVTTRPSHIPESVKVLHTMEDAFVVIVPSSWELSEEDRLPSKSTWLLPAPDSEDRGLIDIWMQKQGVEIQQQVELENYDMMVHLCSLGMGAAVVPRRCLGQFPRKKLIQRLSVSPNLSRQLVVLAPKQTYTPDHVQQFLDGILFS